jgi:hypothetical protein
MFTNRGGSINNYGLPRATLRTRYLTLLRFHVALSSRQVIMPRSMPFEQLISTLASHIGRDNARQELKWMIQAIHSANRTRSTPFPGLLAMLSRRVRGEPIQYILGMGIRTTSCRVSN